MEERRKIDRVKYEAPCVMVVCDTEEKIFVTVKNMSPLGMGLNLPADSPDVLDKDVIVVAECIIMYATVNRMKKLEDGTYEVGIHAKRFSDEVLQYLFEHIG